MNDEFLPEIPTLEMITTPVRTLNERVLELVTADRALTAAEWAELDTIEKESAHV